MKLLAIDPSLNRTGLCYHDKITAVIECKLVGVHRLVYLRDRLKQELVAMKPAAVVLEDYSFASKGSSILQIAEWGGVLRLLLHELGIPVALVSPAGLKMWATGKGNSKKDAVVSELSKRADRIFPNSDEADAFGLAAMAYDYLGTPWFPMPKDRRKAFDKVKWPEVMGLPQALAALS